MLTLSSRLSTASALAPSLHLVSTSSRVAPMTFNCRLRASSEPRRVLASSKRFSANALPAALSASVALACKSWTWMSWSNTCRSTIAICSGGMVWPRAAACALSRTTSSSNWPWLTSTPLPLATIVFPKRLVGLAAGFGPPAVSVEAGRSGAAPQTGSDAARSSRTEDSIILFINIFFRSTSYNTTTLTLLMSGSL